MASNRNTDLFNRKVETAIPMKRPLDTTKPVPTWGYKATDFAKHTGVLATLDDGSKMLLHKVPETNERRGGTFVTDAGHMSQKWEADGPARTDIRGVTVSDLVNAGGDKYSLPWSNCQHANKDMLGVIDKSQKKP